MATDDTSVPDDEPSQDTPEQIPEDVSADTPDGETAPKERAADPAEGSDAESVPADDGTITEADLEALMAQATGEDESGAAADTSPSAEAGIPESPAEEPVAAEAVEMPDFDTGQGGGDPNAIEMLGDVELDVKIELGRNRMLVEDVLKLGAGSVVELDKLAGDPVDVFVNERLVARGEVLVVNDNFCVRINEILSVEAQVG